MEGLTNLMPNSTIISNRSFKIFTEVKRCALLYNAYVLWEPRTRLTDLLSSKFIYQKMNAYLSKAILWGIPIQCHTLILTILFPEINELKKIQLKVLVPIECYNDETMQKCFRDATNAIVNLTSPRYGN